MLGNIQQIIGKSQPIFPELEGGMISSLAKSDLPEVLKKADNPEVGSNQQSGLGVVPHPFNFQVACEMVRHNEHHAACINAKVRSMVGLGHPTDPDRIDDILNPVCESTWQETIMDVAEDYHSTGNGYLEVVRRGSEIAGLFHVRSPSVYPVFEGGRDRHFIVNNNDPQLGTGLAVRMASFGDKEDFLNRAREGFLPNDTRRNASNLTATGGVFAAVDLENEDNVSEVIHFRRPTSLSKWYGFPNWLGALAGIELIQMVMQHNFDFYLNRGVPEFMLFLLGAKLDSEDMNQITNAIKANIGLGNSHKSMAVNLDVPIENFRVQLEKLMGESGLNDDAFAVFRENLAMGIVSAHGVPPLLAGIQIPGKLGATNELPNALMAFQVLQNGPDQRLFTQKLAATLGSPEYSNLGLSREDFMFKPVTEEINIAEMDTVARMRQSPAQAQAEGRDLSAGVLD